MPIKEPVTVLFPHLARVCVDRVTRCGTSVQIKARTTTDEAGCFRCGNEACARQTFAGQVPGLTVRHGRRGTGAGEALRAIALAPGGRRAR
ncbi:hypothetical protein [Actinomadura algeriensis]|uniref:Uncharacterized protein n=1 Tax=Actinomadura algeriensis TaxID=1679523 RepID=A0ABR9JZT1_9ACTN|nr:hypothetical protein [Actinomadura algeriensis]MBE1535846.1 hypothetical protein [Actinomadura algeriensis]